MDVLRTVDETRRERAMVLLASGLLAFLFAWAAFAWWVGRPGASVERALGVSLPAGSRQVHEEHVEVDPDAPYDAVYVSATWTVDEAVERLAAIATDSNVEARRFEMRDGTLVTVLRPDEIPATRLLPIQPVTEGVPLGTRSWIIVTRGTPPAATWSAAVPPNLES
jgi:hypothetical protein